MGNRKKLRLCKSGTFFSPYTEHSSENPDTTHLSPSTLMQRRPDMHKLDTAATAVCEASPNTPRKSEEDCIRATSTNSSSPGHSQKAFTYPFLARKSKPLETSTFFHNSNRYNPSSNLQCVPYSPWGTSNAADATPGASDTDNRLYVRNEEGCVDKNNLYATTAKTAATTTSAATLVAASPVRTAACTGKPAVLATPAKDIICSADSAFAASARHFLQSSNTSTTKMGLVENLTNTTSESVAGPSNTFLGQSSSLPFPQPSPQPSPHSSLQPSSQPPANPSDVTGKKTLFRFLQKGLRQTDCVPAALRPYSKPTALQNIQQGIPTAESDGCDSKAKECKHSRSSASITSQSASPLEREEFLSCMRPDNIMSMRVGYFRDFLVTPDLVCRSSLYPSSTTLEFWNTLMGRPKASSAKRPRKNPRPWAVLVTGSSGCGASTFVKQTLLKATHLFSVVLCVPAWELRTREDRAKFDDFRSLPLFTALIVEVEGQYHTLTQVLKDSYTRSINYYRDSKIPAVRSTGPFAIVFVQTGNTDRLEHTMATALFRLPDIHWPQAEQCALAVFTEHPTFEVEVFQFEPPVLGIKKVTIATVLALLYISPLSFHTYVVQPVCEHYGSVENFRQCWGAGIYDKSGGDALNSSRASSARQFLLGCFREWIPMVPRSRPVNLTFIHTAALWLCGNERCRNITSVLDMYAPHHDTGSQVVAAAAMGGARALPSTLGFGPSTLESMCNKLSAWSGILFAGIVEHHRPMAPERFMQEQKRIIDYLRKRSVPLTTYELCSLSCSLPSSLLLAQHDKPASGSAGGTMNTLDPADELNDKNQINKNRVNRHSRQGLAKKNTPLPLKPVMNISLTGSLSPAELSHQLLSYSSQMDSLCAAHRLSSVWDPTDTLGEIASHIVVRSTAYHRRLPGSQKSLCFAQGKLELQAHQVSFQLS
jgi:hypothetical protein